MVWLGGWLSAVEWVEGGLSVSLGRWAFGNGKRRKKARRWVGAASRSSRLVDRAGDEGRWDAWRFGWDGIGGKYILLLLQSRTCDPRPNAAID